MDADTLHFLDVFLMHCLLSDSPPDSPQEIRDLAHNQHLTAARGREPGLKLLRQGQPVELAQWGLDLLDELHPLAAEMDRLMGGEDHARAVQRARDRLLAPETLPSARVLHALREEHQDSFVAFALSRSHRIREELLALPWQADQQVRYESESAESMAAQKKIEASDTMPFEIYRQEYVSSARLGVPAELTTA